MKNVILVTLGVMVLAAGYVHWKPKLLSHPTPRASVTVPPPPTPRIKPKASATPVIPMMPESSVTPNLPSSVPTATPTPAVAAHQDFHVNIQNHAYSITPLTVKKGDRVIFKNLDPSIHTVTAFNLQFNSKNIQNGQEWTLDTATLAPGTYDYRCTIHTSMRGTLIVQ
jgi:plastocyanin